MKFYEKILNDPDTFFIDRDRSRLVYNINGWASKEYLLDELRLGETHPSDTLPVPHTIDKGVKIIVELIENCTSGDKAHLMKKREGRIHIRTPGKG